MDRTLPESKRPRRSGTSAAPDTGKASSRDPAHTRVHEAGSDSCRAPRASPRDSRASAASPGARAGACESAPRFAGVCAESRRSRWRLNSPKATARSPGARAGAWGAVLRFAGVCTESRRSRRRVWSSPEGHLGHSLPPGRICRSLEGERIFPALQDPGSTSLLGTVHVAFLLAIPQMADRNHSGSCQCPGSSFCTDFKWPNSIFVLFLPDFALIPIERNINFVNILGHSGIQTELF
ncbi:uncharacterized protein LOC125921587 [Panthera uncia]|uniref:uncharacterized protein LOC125921587 n=1 Tax=Panthera uncia TaxID=29064 RepID=UPI0020FFC3DE|nr:uncharacterized protein LOC125921587 [Panthera uncia]